MVVEEVAFEVIAILVPNFIFIILLIIINFLINCMKFFWVCMSVPYDLVLAGDLNLSFVERDQDTLKLYNSRSFGNVLQE